MVSPSLSSEKIQVHLYQSFLNGATSDVSLKCIAPTWSRVYPLHRVILIQGGFFNSLFTNGWREGSRDGDNPDSIQITFEDPNITRAAFEVCLSRLYGGGPELSLSPHLRPSISDPLTRSFPNPPPYDLPLAGHHPATPRFLLSLLATATYLSMPNVASQALNLIMQSLGPYTVMRYLGFSIGKGIGEELPNEPTGAAGLENVGKPILLTDLHPRMLSAGAGRSVKHSPSNSTICSKKRGTGMDGINETVLNSQGNVTDEDDSVSISDNVSYITVGTQEDHENSMAPHYFYGALGNLIGEACASWLCRWGIDMFHWEQAICNAEKTKEGTFTTNEYPLPIVPPQALASLKSSNSPYGTHPIIWAPGGLSVQWIRGIISSDSFFVPNESERYAFASQVHRFRRSFTEGEDDAFLDDQREWDLLFKTGIYYSHMTFNQLREIEEDGLVPLQTLALAHWRQSLLRSIITTRPNNGAHSLPGANASPTNLATPELGIAVTTDKIKPLLQVNRDVIEEASQKPYFPVFGDSSLRTGDYLSTDPGGPVDYTSALMTSMEQLDGTPPSKRSSSFLRRAADESTFFGIASSRKTANLIAKEEASGITRWTEFEPIRFSSEWWGVETLKEKARMYGSTIAYAGSFYNVCVRVTRGKSLLLGFYLNRQSMIDPVPVASTPPGRRDRSYTLPLSMPITSIHPTPQIPTRVSRFTGPVSTSPPNVVSSLPPNNHHHALSLSDASSIPNMPSSSIATTYASVYHPSSLASLSALRLDYRDPRPVLQAYFRIMSPSATGTSMTTFSSGPDEFGVSQSWGWKSGTGLEIPITEDMEVSGEGLLAFPSIMQWKRGLSSVRATMMIGVV